MTDDLSMYGLGALPDAPDERDYPLSALYAAEGLTASVILPASYAAPGMPPALDQHATPMCVAYSSSAVKAWQDRRDQERFFDFDEPAFFAAIGGTDSGACVRDAMERMRSTGYPVAGSGDATHHRIAAYYDRNWSRSAGGQAGSSSPSGWREPAEKRRGGVPSRTMTTSQRSRPQATAASAESHDPSPSTPGGSDRSQ